VPRKGPHHQHGQQEDHEETHGEGECRREPIRRATHRQAGYSTRAVPIIAANRTLVWVSEVPRTYLQKNGSMAESQLQMKLIMRSATMKVTNDRFTRVALNASRSGRPASVPRARARGCRAGTRPGTRRHHAQHQPRAPVAGQLAGARPDPAYQQRHDRDPERDPDHCGDLPVDGDLGPQPQVRVQLGNRETYGTLTAVLARSKKAITTVSQANMPQLRGLASGWPPSGGDQTRKNSTRRAGVPRATYGTRLAPAGAGPVGERADERVVDRVPHAVGHAEGQAHHRSVQPHHVDIEEEDASLDGIEEQGTPRLPVL